ncbi:LacI family DNA-binding transcriptional regulator [Brevundimonas albigilva]|uniref:LacI family DNA-binding transcriptional regulator n=1 Tax=Brevundimonas albigilva TaxID=1312364 RepID=A0ABY4SL04_9CAUL|nr:LacI family DNA-binding transcriptional regulator [Brevundimonas albigilva]URI15626.1 LacI family DNA-binding transcriptional regulator [Brevundimonas albigilva]
MQRKSTRRKGGGRTIDDVARHAGVSPMTVSRVINGERNVRDATRLRVTEAIRELGYAPNQAARSLASAQTLKIGLLYSNPSAAYLSEFLLGGLDQCSRAGAQLVVEKCEPEAGETVAIERMLTAGVDGVLLPPPLCDSALVVDRLEAAGLPAVAVASGEPMPSVSAIRIDDEAAAEAMTRHLIGLGHRRIAFVRGHPNQTASGLRFKGYAQALKAHGIEVDDRLVAQGYFTYHSGLDAADQLLTLRRRPTALFASNDDMAAAAIAVAHRQGLDVPRDLTIVGFDDTALASTVWPPLTTIRQPVAEMSREAVSVLVDAIRRKADGQPGLAARELMGFALIRRQSDGHPPAEPGAPPARARKAAS